MILVFGMEKYSFIIILLLPLKCTGSPDCDTFTDCVTCTSHKTWSGANCRWCPLDRECHAQGSVVNSCRKEQNIVSSHLCPANAYGIYDPEVALTSTLLSAVAYSDDPKRCMKRILPMGEFELDQVIGRRCEDLPLFAYKECYAYTAVSHARRLIVLAYRGTVTNKGNSQIYDEIVSVLLKPKVSFLIGGEVQNYFKQAFDKLSPCVFQSISELVSQFPDYNVIVTGHSLGGAIASLSAAALVHKGIVTGNKLSLYTFGMPRVGDKGYAFNHDKLLNSSWRVVHARDVVAHLPTCNLLFSCRVTTNGPYHHRTEIFYPDDKMTTSSRYIQCEGNEDDRCSNSVVSKDVCFPGNGLNECFDYHKKYFDVPVGTYCSKTSDRKRRSSEGSLMWEQLSSERCERITLTDDDTSGSPTISEGSIVKELSLILVICFTLGNRSD